jgi:1-acyl-sn-glycerol-3-phosphate acyltransferase
MFNFLARLFFRWAGWQAIGLPPRSLKKSILIVCPHATWKDVLVGFGSRACMKMPNVGYLGKAELFKPPFGWFFYATGGNPVVRNSNNNVVDSVKQLFDKKETLHIALAPEGTRKNVSQLRTGFYYMAHGAGVPIVMVGFDFPRKTVVFAEPFMPTGNFEEDKVKIASFYKSIQGIQKDWINLYLSAEL